MPRPKTKTKLVNLRMTEEQLATLKNRHAATFPEHRLPFSTWLLKLILREAG